MGAEIQAFDIFQTPLSSHYPLPLKDISQDGTYRDVPLLYTNQVTISHIYAQEQPY